MIVRSFCIVSVLLASAAAQKPEAATGFVATHQALLDARNDVVVLNVAAHPDDESSRTNTVLRRKHGMRIVTVYSTYGDGGQNAISREIGPALAKIRVGETLRASAMSGAPSTIRSLTLCTLVEAGGIGMPGFTSVSNCSPLIIRPLRTRTAPI